jgi:hypothetical protein
VQIGGATSTSKNNLYVYGGLQTMHAIASQYGASPQIYANWDNHVGGGIAISDDCGFYDYNDGFVTFNGWGDGNTGLRIAGLNGTASNDSILEVNGLMATNGFNQKDLPGGWAGGIRTIDVYSSGTVAVGPGGGIVSTGINNDGIYTDKEIILGNSGTACTSANVGPSITILLRTRWNFAAALPIRG